MGREIRRVPLDFDWPRDKVWQGFIRPDELRGDDCPECYNGQTWAGWWLQRLCFRIGMLADDVREQRRGRPLHPWLAEDPYPVTTEGKYDRDRHRWIEEPQVVRPSEDIVKLIAGLAGETEERVLSSMGSYDYKLFSALVKAAGLEDEGWGGCPRCEGHGTLESYPGQRDDAETWEPTDPPEGGGWQLWETVSEGSPISPVFESAEEMAQWLTTRDACWGAMRQPMTLKQARGFVSEGWAPSGIADASGVHDGATWVGDHAH